MPPQHLATCFVLFDAHSYHEDRHQIMSAIALLDRHHLNLNPLTSYASPPAPFYTSGSTPSAAGPALSHSAKTPY